MVAVDKNLRKRNYAYASASTIPLLEITPSLSRQRQLQETTLPTPTHQRFQLITVYRAIIHKMLLDLDSEFQLEICNT